MRLRRGTRRVIDKAAGYAVFSTFGIKVFFAGGTTGKGVVVNQRTHRQTFMKMVQVQGGLGFGVNQNRLIFVFTNEPALRNFIDQGWEFGSQANLSAMAGGQGTQFSGAAAVSPGVYVYQLTNTGLSASITVSGTKYFKDRAMNDFVNFNSAVQVQRRRAVAGKGTARPSSSGCQAK